MSLFSRPIRPPETDLDDAVTRHLEALRADLKPDPLYRRRLRGSTLNRYVAAREQVGTRREPRDRRAEMGRLGRSVLIASVALAASSATVLGSAQDALPGDPLYGVKLRVEALRFEVVPDHLHGVLAADVVGARVDEVARLMAAGRHAEAAALQPAIAEGLARLTRDAATAGPASQARAAQQVALLEAYVARLPAGARSMVVAAWDAALPFGDALPTSPVTGAGSQGPGAAGGGPAASPPAGRDADRSLGDRDGTPGDPDESAEPRASTESLPTADPGSHPSSAPEAESPGQHPHPTPRAPSGD